ncbi:hypothetical protein PhaeoP48_01225 [Phaeobacter inhibens]|uniref:hypothetical protein n=1 Tax=Phaeobacter inhibens TaxID=221822 RepID=UPI000CA330B1|nr:hypothetical protein [Phaeobacter inhibens]AUR11222.1 hypothetical protein PhaeoP48_01225 [Phaeobacter inhibens]
MMNLSPLARIALRYVVGALFFGSDQIGAQLAADPDIVAVCALLIGALVEASYALAKRKGWHL